jgi:hypothetical protein
MWVVFSPRQEARRARPLIVGIVIVQAVLIAALGAGAAARPPDCRGTAFAHTPSAYLVSGTGIDGEMCQSLVDVAGNGDAIDLFWAYVSAHAPWLTRIIAKHDITRVPGPSDLGPNVSPTWEIAVAPGKVHDMAVTARKLCVTLVSELRTLGALRPELLVYDETLGRPLVGDRSGYSYDAGVDVPVLAAYPAWIAQNAFC